MATVVVVSVVLLAGCDPDVAPDDAVAAEQTSTPAPAPTAAATPTPTPTEQPGAALPEGDLAVHFIDVGQGDATLLHASDATVLVDTGRHDRKPEPAEPDAGCAPGQVNLNTASAEELEQITHIGPDRAQQIINLRPFDNVDALTRVDGIAEARLRDIKQQGPACA